MSSQLILILENASSSSGEKQWPAIRMELTVIKLLRGGKCSSSAAAGGELKEGDGDGFLFSWQPQHAAR